MLSTGADYTDLGAEYFTRLNPDRALRRAIATLNTLGYTVELNPIQAPHAA